MTLDRAMNEPLGMLTYNELFDAVRCIGAEKLDIRQRWYNNAPPLWQRIKADPQLRCDLFGPMPALRVYNQRIDELLKEEDERRRGTFREAMDRKSRAA